MVIVDAYNLLLMLLDSVKVMLYWIVTFLFLIFFINIIPEMTYAFNGLLLIVWPKFIT